MLPLIARVENLERQVAELKAQQPGASLDASDSAELEGMLNRLQQEVQRLHEEARGAAKT